VTTFIPNKQIQELQLVLEKFVETAQPKGGVAYLLRCVDPKRGFFVPIVCSNKTLFKLAPYYLLFYKLSEGVTQSGPIEESLNPWLNQARIEALLFSEGEEIIHQEFTTFFDKRFVLVRSQPSKAPDPLPELAGSMSGCLLPSVFDQWASSSYDGLLGSVSANASGVTLESVVKTLANVLDDRDAFPPYWPFLYFSLQAQSGESTCDTIRANPLGFARWSLDTLSASRPPWIETMAAMERPGWEDIQLVAKSNAAYDTAIQAGDQTARLLIEQLSDWIVPVCNFAGWKFFARHNKSKGCKCPNPHSEKNVTVSSFRKAVAAILTHEQQESNEAHPDLGDFLLTLWGIHLDEGRKVNNAQLIGCRVGEDFKGILKKLHPALPKEAPFKDGSNEHVKLELRFMPLEGINQEDLDGQLKKLEAPTLAALRCIDPRRSFARFLEEVLIRHDQWNEFFPRQYHDPYQWKSRPDADFAAVKKAVRDALKDLSSAMQLAEADLSALAQESWWCLHVAKAFQHGRVAPELISFLASKRAKPLPRAYELCARENGIDVSLNDLASDLLYGFSLMCCHKPDRMSLVEFYVREQGAMEVDAPRRHIVGVRFEGDGRETPIPDAARRVLSQPPQSSGGSQLQRARAILEKHTFCLKVGKTINQRFGMLFEFLANPIDGNCNETK
jgi:hypothetical protein